MRMGDQKVVLLSMIIYQSATPCVVIDFSFHSTQCHGGTRVTLQLNSGPLTHRVFLILTFKVPDRANPGDYSEDYAGQWVSPR